MHTNPTEPAASNAGTRADHAVLLALFAILMGIGPFSMQIFVPALPSIERYFEVTTVQAQLALSLSMVAMSMGALFGGPLSDLFGRRPLLLAGLGLSLTGGLICMVAPSLPVLILGRIIQATGGAAVMTLTRAVIGDLYDRQEAARVLSYAIMAMVVAPMIAPALGGVLIATFDWRANFALAAVLAAIGLVLVCTRLHETHPDRTTDSFARTALQLARNSTRLLRNRVFLAFAAHVGTATAVFFAFLGGAAYLVENVMGLTAADYGLFFMLVAGGYMLGNFVSARLTERFSIERMIVTGSCWSLTWVLVLLGLMLAGWWNPWALFLPMSCVSFGHGLSMANALASAVNVDPTVAGAASSLSGFCQLSVGAIATQTVAVLLDGSPVPMALVMAVCGVLAFGAALYCRRLAVH